jgi:hypothetical protein
MARASKEKNHEYYLEHRQAHLDRAKARHKRLPDDQWIRHLAKDFRITPEQYYEILRRQGGGCAICGTKTLTKKYKGTPARHPVDHDHKTGIVRGILCDRCNRGLGLLGDSVEILRSALEYLEKQPWR